MSGLVGYGSSDEEDSASSPSLKPSRSPAQGRSARVAEAPIKESHLGGIANPHSNPSIVSGEAAAEDGANQTADKQDAGERGDTPGNLEASYSYEETKAALRNLTLPTVPNLDIPPSPPGSPPMATNKKVAQFLELKKKGVHFNEKLARSSAMKNPSLLGKLMTFAGLEPGEQYASTLPSNLWDPQGLPPWAFKDELGKAQQEAQKKRDEDRARVGRSAGDFVRASESSHSDGSAKPGARDARDSVADKVTVRLSRDRTRADPGRGGGYRRRSRSPGRHRK